MSKKKKVAERKITVAGEMRQDLITGNWVVMAPGRSLRPLDYSAQRRRPQTLPKYRETCPFCNVTAYPQRPDVLRLPDDPDRWQVHIFPNKFPALDARDEFRSWDTGPYRALEAVGYHEILAPRWHHATDAHISPAELALQFEALVLRYRQLREKPAVNYIQIIKNHGELAGASLEHPHHQLFGLPVLPSDVMDMLRGAQERAATLGEDPFQVMLDFERESGERVIQENEYFTAFCPFASRAAFEVRIMPREPASYFEDSTVEQREALAELMQAIFARLHTGLNDPAYNYFIYSAPCDETGFVCDRALFSRWRWHVQILPRLGPLGGLEVSTGLEVSEMMPEAAAAFLRSQAAPG